MSRTTSAVRAAARAITVMGIALTLGAGASVGIGVAVAGAQGTLAGYNADTLAIGAQFGFNIPNLLPLPKENILEEDVPFTRINLADGPILDSIGAPYYPGDVAASIGTLLKTDGVPFPVPNDTALAESKFPTSPGYTGHATFGVSPAAATPLTPSVAYSVADTSGGGGDASAVVSNLALLDEGPLKSIVGSLGTATATATATASLVDVGNIASSSTMTVNDSSVQDTASSTVKAIDVAGLIDIADLTSTANASSDGTTGTPTASLRLGQVTVDGQSAYIDAAGVHIASTNSAVSGITPAQLQQTVNATLSQDGITIRLINPELTSSGGTAAADAGGLQIVIAHQIDVPFIPGEPNIPLPQLGNQGLPAGLYTVTTSLTFGLAQASVSATSLASEAFPALPTLPLTTTGTSTDTGLGTDTGSSLSTAGTFAPASIPTTTQVPATGPGTTASAAPVAVPAAVNSSSTDFPIRGVPAPIGWAVAALLSCVILCYPLLLLARWQFINPRRR